MNQFELRSMAEERVLDAAALLSGNRWSYAFYVAGYAVECALKSCVLSRMIHTGGVSIEMDTELLVEERIEEGRSLIAELIRDGFDVSVAFWIKTSEEGLWHLYIGSASHCTTARPYVECRSALANSRRAAWVL